jgi:hypothetical protein
MYMFGLFLTSYARDRNLTWPNVTLPDYERRSHSILAQVNAIPMLVMPIVTNETRAGWDQYSVENFQWFQDGLDFQKEDGYRVGRLNSISTPSKRLLGEMPDFSPGIANSIWRPTAGGIPVDTTGGPYDPLWQNAPALENNFVENINMAALSEYTESFRVCTESRMANIGISVNTDKPNQFQKALSKL